jgi:adenylate kinase family enzyme
MRSRVQRVAIIGSTASGKSTLARRLQAATGIEAFHLDDLYWGPSCTAMPEHEWDALLDQLVSRPTWIIDGNFTASLPRRLAAADTVILLDLPRIVCLVAAVKRRLLFRVRRPPGMARGCPPMFNRTLVGWIWSFPDDHTPYYLELLREAVPGRTALVLRHRRDVHRFVHEVEARARA